MMTLANYLKRQKIKQADFAASIGLTQGTVSKLCGEEPKILFETAMKIEEATDGEVPVESWPQFSALKNRNNQNINSEADGSPENAGAA